MPLPRSTAEQWAVLSAVVELGSYARAAQALHRSQPAVSYAIANLQESLGVKLLEIQGRRAVLTPHGDTLLKRARSVLRELDTVERLAQVLKQGWEPRLRLVVDAAVTHVVQQRVLAGQLQEPLPGIDELLIGKPGYIAQLQVEPGGVAQLLHRSRHRGW